MQICISPSTCTSNAWATHTGEGPCIAERGLFLRPGTYFIPISRRICCYQEEYDAVVDPTLTSDYLFEVSGQGRTYYFGVVHNTSVLQRVLLRAVTDMIVSC